MSVVIDHQPFSVQPDSNVRERLPMMLACRAEFHPEAAPAIRSADPNDDYLLALASAERAVLVSGDGHLTALADRLPIRTPVEFLASLDESRA